MYCLALEYDKNKQKTHKSLQVWNLVSKIKNEPNIYLAFFLWTVTSDSQWVEIPVDPFQFFWCRQQSNRVTIMYLRIEPYISLLKILAKEHWLFLQIKENTGDRKCESSGIKKI